MGPKRSLLPANDSKMTYFRGDGFANTTGIGPGARQCLAASTGADGGQQVAMVPGAAQ